MKFSRKLLLIPAALLALGAHGELATWIQYLPANALEAVFFKTVPMPAGPVQSRRPPRETVQDLTRQIAAAPGRADLVSLRAHEAELNLDFTTAEQDWKSFARLKPDKLQGNIALADYYHRRLQPTQELAALLEAAALPAAGRDQLNEPAQQQSWKLFERALALTQAQAMPVDTTVSLYDAWITRYSQSTAAYSGLISYLVDRREMKRAEQVIARYAKAFPKDEAFVLESRAKLLPPDEAVKLYERSFRPVMAANVVQEYFRLLGDTRSLRSYLANARAAAAANPNDLVPAAKLFYYYQQSGNLAQAHRALLEYRLRRPQPSPEELLALATLFEQTNNYVEAARAYNDLAKLSTPRAEQGYAGLIRILFTAPEQPLPIGGGDISFYKDIATMDPYPGTLNGILSLLFNSTSPSWKYADEERAAVPYFHRVKAAELLVEMEKRFPQSTGIPDLQAMLLDAYSKHGEDAELIKRGEQFLSAHPTSNSRVSVYLLIADARARRNEVALELGVYDALLKELATSAQNVPLGSASDSIPGPAEEQAGGPPPKRSEVRSARYAEVLDRYINRLVSLKRVNDALALYRREIDRNPNDPGLYERLAEFLNQNKIAAQIEQVYTRAIQQFQDTAWNQKLARWYLRQKQTAAFDRLTKQITTTFNGADLETYFQQVVASANLDAALYRQVNLYAHERFPHDLVFVKNLLAAYQTKGTADQNAYVALLRQNWYHDNELRSRFFEYLARTGKLDAELASLRSTSAMTLSDRAATELIAGVEIWRGHFENAAPVMQILAMNYPAHRELNTTSSSLFRSLGQVENAAKTAERLARSEPRRRGALTLVGEIYADKDQIDKARSYWNRVAEIEPGRPDGYQEAAAVFWDYFQYDDALRIISEGRTKLRDPNAFAYEAGAIYENKREYAKAIDEYLKGAKADPDSPSRRRLVRLAARPQHRDAIESATRTMASGPSADLKAWNLRVALLEEQNRRDDIASLLTSTISATTSFDLLARVEQVAERNGFPQIKEQTLNREAAITPDPIERTRLRLQLARLAEERKDLNGAQRAIETAYKDNQNIAGVVRSTVDYYWRANNRKRAVDILEEAAGRSNTAFRRQFLLEAARKSTEAADYRRARGFLTPMLANEPLASDLVAAMAETYSRAGDDAGLKTFYAERLKLARTPEEQAALRRGLIPVLTRTKDYSAAVEEYIAILNRFPEDEQLAGEAARYARKYGQSDRLTGFYSKAVTDSPKDARWPMVLARIQTGLENLPGARESYTKALAIRPDRSDLLAARAGIEERLLRFEDAAASYAKLYDLAYKDPQYMVKVAEARARLGQRGPAIDALRTAFIEGRAAKAEAYLEIATKLESWNWLPEAKQYVSDARKMDAESGKVLEARILGRLRQYSALDSEEAIAVVSQIAKDFYTPEEKTAFGTWLMKLPMEDKARYALMAGLQDIAVRDLENRIKATPDLALAEEAQRLIQIQQQRLRNGDLAVQLEAFSKALPANENKSQLLVQAADNWRLNGNIREELRVRDLLAGIGVSGDATRYADLLLRVSPDRLAQAVARGDEALKDAAFAVAYRAPDQSTAMKIVSSWGASRKPVWSRAYTALMGVYFDRHEPEFNNAFTGLFGPRTIGEQLATKPDLDQQVVGDTWFYYAARFGEWSKAEDYLPAEVESRPASAAPYAYLGDYYRAAKLPAKALEEYTHALQLDPGAALVHNRMAEILKSQGKAAEAQQHWKEAIRLFAEMQERRVPEEFWDGLAATIESAGPALRADIDKLLRTYVRRNGTYRFDPILQAIWHASNSPAEAARWLSDLSTSSVEPAEFLASVVSNDLVGKSEREILYARLLDLARQEAERRAGDARNDAQYRYRDYQIRYIRLLVQEKQAEKAAEILRSLPDETRNEMRHAVVPLEIATAAATGKLDTILRRDDIEAELLKNSAAELKKNGDEASARRLLEALYNRELDRNNLDVSNFVGLAEIRLEQNDVPGALALLRRMTIVGGEPFETLTAAADLLTRFKHPAEAAEFWSARVKSTPWDYDAAVQLAKANNDAAALTKLAADNQARYLSRIDAAKSLKGATGLGAAELELLASTTNLVQAAVEKPYQYFARVRAASETNDAALRSRLLRGAIAIDPTPKDAKLTLFQTHFAAGQFDQAIAVYKFTSDDISAATIRDLATAYRKVGDLATAKMQLQRAANLDGSIDVKTELASLDTELKRIEENSARAPRVHNNVDQTVKVRSRV